tara:strand:+ start:2152 stop:2505 length:354 start_codon:yes stop_codon:yes gene_type:complete
MQRHLALIYYSGKLLASGKNGYSGRKHSKSVASTHAEIDALQRLKPPKRPNRLRVISLRYDKYDNQMYSKPCKNCLLSLQEFGIDKISYYDGECMVCCAINSIIDTAILSSGDRNCV